MARARSSLKDLIDVKINNSVEGELIYKNLNRYTNLPPDADGKVLTLVNGYPTWTTPSFISDAYKYITDGVNTAVAVGGDTFKLRSANNILGIVVTNNDPTHGDNALFTIVEENINHNNLGGLTSGDPHTQYQLRDEKNVAGGYAGLNASGKINASQIQEVIALKDLTDVDDDLSLVAGDLLYKPSSGGLTRLPIGSDGQVLTVVSGLPAWVTPSGSGGGTPGGANGAVQFNASGTFGGDATNFFWDNTNKRLGIGTSAPSATIHSLSTGEQLRLGYDASNAVKFTVNSTNALTITPLVNNTSGFRVTNAGGTTILNIDTVNQRVGIGTSTPSQRLHVSGNFIVDGSGRVAIGTTTLVGGTRLYISPDAANTVGLRIGGTTRSLGANSNFETFNQIDGSSISGAVTVEEVATLNIIPPNVTGGATANRLANLVFWNTADGMLLVARSDVGAGKNLTIQAGGGRGTNKMGGELRLSSGIATGTGSSFISFYTATAGSDGSDDNLPGEKMRITGDGKVGIRTTSPTALLHLNGATGYNQLRLATSYTPTGSSDANGNVGDIAWDNSYIYVKTGVGWKRAALSTF
jgi:hypothetical protein